LIKVLCIGPIYLDINCLEFPCENGLRTEEEAIGRSYEVVPGGSAVNFARFGRSLGLETILTGNVGGDPFGEMVSRMLGESGVSLSVTRDQDALTDLGLNFVASSGVSVLASAGSATELLTEAALSRTVSGQIGGLSYIYLGGCFKLPHLLTYFESLAREAKHQNLTTVLDHGRVPKNTPANVIERMRSLASAVDVYLPSREEFLKLWETDSLQAGAEKALGSGVDKERLVVVKDGAAGAIGFAADGKVEVPAYDVPVRSTVGAGDSFNAGFIRASSLSQDLEESVDFACASGAVKIAGAHLPTSESVTRLQREGARIPHP
jgi:sugar/nucleoside kinase (ribokinase family)